MRKVRRATRRSLIASVLIQSDPSDRSTPMEVITSPGYFARQVSHSGTMTTETGGFATTLGATLPRASTFLHPVSVLIQDLLAALLPIPVHRVALDMFNLSGLRIRWGSRLRDQMQKNYLRRGLR